MSTFIELTQVSSFLGIRLGASFFHGFGRYRVRRGREVAYATVVHFDRQWLDAYICWHKGRGEHEKARALRQEWLAAHKVSMQ